MKIPTPNMLVGAYIKDMRKAKGYSIRGLCREIELSAQHLSEIERGVVKASAPVITELAKKLDLDVAELMARGGVIPDQVKQYIAEHPAAGVLLQRLIRYNLSDRSIRLFINHIDAVVENSRTRKKEIEDKKKSVH